MMKVLATILGLLVRHALTALGVNDVVTGDEQEKLVGALLVILGIIWSVMQKYDGFKKAAAVAVRLMKAAGLVSLLFLVGCTTVSFDSTGRVKEVGFYGRGCVDVITSSKQTWVTVQTDGVTNWIANEVSPIVRDTAAAVMVALQAPADILRSFFGLPPTTVIMTNDVHGCLGVLEAEPTKAPPTPGTLQRLRDWLTPD